MIVLDFITGILSAIYNKELESRACLKGIIKKSCYFLLVIVAHGLDTLVPNDGTFLLRTITIYFLVANDGLSILENVGECGVEYPNFLKNFLKQLRTKADEGNIQSKDEPIEEPEVEEKELFDSTYKALFPCEEGGITIKYSDSHKGIDVGWIAIENCKVISVDDGVVVQAESYIKNFTNGKTSRITEGKCDYSGNFVFATIQTLVKVIERNETLLEVRTFAGSSERAKKIVNNWNKNASKIYPKIYL